jgi:RNA polymerase sigma factor (TIGR02999 family)
MAEVTNILSALQRGDPRAADQLLPLVYEELRKLAAEKLTQEKPGQTLQPTALVHEAYLRLVGGQQFDNRGHFFVAAAEAMRRLLIDKARRKATQKRGGQRQRQELDAIAAPQRDEELLALDEALERLAGTDAQAAELVKLRYFAGLSQAESAEVLGVSTRTADRIWAFARAWLRQAISRAR